VQQFVYVANSQSNNVSAYSIDATGALTPIGTPVAAGSLPISVAVDPAGRFVYVANIDSDDVSAYTIGATGALTPTGPPVPAGLYPHSVTMDPTGRFVYVANLGNILLGPGTVSAYSIDATGALTPIGAPVAAGTGPIAVAVDATGRFVYVANNGPVLGAGDVSAYSVGVTGTLTQIGTPAPVDSPPSSPTSIAVDPAGRFVYVATASSGNIVGNDVCALSIDATGALTPLGCTAPASAGFAPVVSVDPAGRFIYVVNQLGPAPNFAFAESSSILAYSIGATGVLTPIGAPVPAENRPFGLAVDPAGRFVYVANLGSNNISAYSIDATGALTALGLPVPAGLAPIKLAVTGSSERIQGRIDLICRPLDAEPGLFGSAVPFLGRHCYFETSSLNSVHTYGAYPISAHLAPRKDYISDFANGQPRIPGGCGTAVLATECVNIPVLQSQTFEGIVDGLEQAVSAGSEGIYNKVDNNSNEWVQRRIDALELAVALPQDVIANDGDLCRLLPEIRANLQVAGFPLVEETILYFYGFAECLH